MPTPLQPAGRCAHPGAAPSAARRTRGAMPARTARGAAAPNAAVVADSKRSLVYGVHAVSAALERAPERVLELWIAGARDDARTRDLNERAARVGVHVHAASADALSKLVGDVVHQ